ncbi:MAG: hypothetical protein RL385_1680 [Pseudomonadota bacterium]|jgi:hypothetical protein
MVRRALGPKLRDLNITALISGLLSSCSAEPLTPRTELMLVAGTDIAELTDIAFELTAPDHATVSERGAVPSDRAPLTLGILRTQGALGPITAVAHGFVGPREVLQRRAVVWFVEGRTVVVPLHLLAACVGISCGPAETCATQGCESAELDSDALAEWTGDVAGPQPVGVGVPHDSAVASTDASEAGSVYDASALQEAGMDVGSDAGDAGLPSDASGALPDDAGSNADAAVDAGIDPGPPVDAGSDAGVDAALDAGGSNGGNDAGSNGSSDAGEDAGSDGGCSATPEALQSDPNNCGSCGHVCPTTWGWMHYAPACIAGVCAYACSEGYGDCSFFSPGCETALNYDGNCGACGKSCSTGQTCVSGACTP